MRWGGRNILKRKGDRMKRTIDGGRKHKETYLKPLIPPYNTIQ